jgi:hypothetical protein
MTEPAAAKAPEPVPASSGRPIPPVLDQGGFFLRHDLLPVVVAALLFAAGWVGYRAVTRPRLAAFSTLGLSFHYPSSLSPLASGAQADASSVEIRFLSLGGASLGETMEVRIKPFATPGGTDIGLGAALDSMRARRGHTLMSSDPSEKRSIGGRSWTRTEYKYAEKRADGELILESGVEYAALNGGKLFVVAMEGSPDGVKSLDKAVAGSLVVQ